MTTMVMPETVPGLKTLEVGDGVRYKAAVEAGAQNGWSYFFPFLLAKARPGRREILLTEDSGSLCLFQQTADKRRPRLDLLFPPMPFEPAVLQRALERANDFNQDRSARILRIDEKDAASVATVRSVRVRQRRAQYMFAPATYQSLAGSALHTVRRNVAPIEKRPDVQVTAFQPAHAEACRALLARWSKIHREAHGTTGGVGLTRRTLELAGTLPERDLTGEVVLIGGEVAGFAFGGEIRPGLACSYERKCDTAVRGLSYFQVRSLLLRLRDYPLVNDGSDASRSGLRQLKQSFRPVAMHLEHQARQRRHR